MQWAWPLELVDFYIVCYQEAIYVANCICHTDPLYDPGQPSAYLFAKSVIPRFSRPLRWKLTIISPFK